MTTTSSYEMPFGKYKGYRLNELPDNYLGWLYSLDDLRYPLRARVEEEFQRRRRDEEEFWQRRREEEDGWQTRRDTGYDRPPARTREVVEGGFKTLAKKYHPDVGGSDTSMRELLEARSWLVRAVELNAPQKAAWQ